MARDTAIADKLRHDPVLVSQVVEVAGWQTRGSEVFNPQGFVWHHTAGRREGNSPSLGVCTNGRKGLSGPLCNVFMARDCTLYVVAAGRANHAGAGSWAGLSGNTSVYGLEIENVGQSSEPWTVRQLDVAARVASALGVPTGNMCLHKEWTSRKVDMHTISGAAMRQRVDALRAAPEVSCVSEAAKAPAPNPLLALRQSVDAAKRHVLSKGDKGDHVAALQILLVSKGVDIAIDGVFGRKTEQVVKFLQTSAGLRADGVVGPATWRMLDR